MFIKKNEIKRKFEIYYKLKSLIFTHQGNISHICKKLFRYLNTWMPINDAKMMSILLNIDIFVYIVVTVSSIKYFQSITDTFRVM